MILRVMGVLLALILSANAVTAQSLAGSYLAASRAALDGDFPAASRLYSQALQSDPDNPMLRQHAMTAYVSAGEFIEARTIAASFARGENVYADLVTMTDLAAKGEYARALEFLPKNDPGFARLLAVLLEAWLETGNGNAEAGLALFDSLQDNDSIRIFGQYHKALALAYLGQLDQALTIIEANGAPLHLNRNAVLAHAQILSQLNRNAEALEVLNTPGIRGTDGDLFEDMREKIASGEMVPFEYIGMPADGMAAAFLTLGEALTRDEPNRLGLFYTRLSEHLRPGFVETILTVADILEREGQYSQAAQAYAQVPQGSAFYKDAVIGQAETQRRSGDVDAAIETLSSLIDMFPNDVNVLNALGDIYRGQERWTEAIDAYSQAITYIPSGVPAYWVVYYTRGISYERSGRWPEAEADFRAALELSPDQPNVLNYLGYSYVEKGENLDEALQMIETAVARDPENGYIRDSLAWVLYRLGRFEDAVPHMIRAAEQLPLDPIINDHLGDVLWMVGRKTEARFQWRRAISFDPEEADLIRIKRKLEVGLDQVLEEESDI